MLEPLFTDCHLDMATQGSMRGAGRPKRYSPQASNEVDQYEDDVHNVHKIPAGSKPTIETAAAFEMQCRAGCLGDHDGSSRIVRLSVD